VAPLSRHIFCTQYECDVDEEDVCLCVCVCRCGHMNTRVMCATEEEEGESLLYLPAEKKRRIPMSKKG